jgi:hypothetical protein
MMIDPERPPHVERVLRAEDQDQEGEQQDEIIVAADQTADGEHERVEPGPERQQRGDGGSPLLGHRAAEEGLQREDQARDRQIDEARPVDVGARGGIEFILAQVEPALPVQQRADLGHAEIVVCVAEREPVDRAPAPPQHVGDRADPEEPEPAPPMRIIQPAAKLVHACALPYGPPAH